MLERSPAHHVADEPTIVLDVVHVKKVGSRTTYLWPNSPLYADNPNVRVPVMLNAFVASLSALGIQQHPEKSSRSWA